MKARAFTLVEIMLVVVIIGILATIAFPMYQNQSHKAEVSTLQVNLRAMHNKLGEQQSQEGAWPASIDGAWFVTGELPNHPQNSIALPVVQNASAGTALHPTNKVLKAGVLGAYWYNNSQGIVRARVTDQGSEAATLEVYNEVNQSDESSLGNYGGGGGGGS